eukprot:COSAG01_NODE_461_length_16698_cov_113.458160_17_plen_206_part_00
MSPARSSLHPRRQLVLLVARNKSLPILGSARRLECEAADMAELRAHLITTLELPPDFVLGFAAGRSEEEEEEEEQVLAPVPITSLDELPDKAKVQVWLPGSPTAAGAVAASPSQLQASAIGLPAAPAPVLAPGAEGGSEAVAAAGAGAGARAGVPRHFELVADQLCRLGGLRTEGICECGAPQQTCCDLRGRLSLSRGAARVGRA